MLQGRPARSSARIASTPLPTSRMIARGSTRWTMPVTISPSRLANSSKTTSRSASRRRCSTTCLAVWAAMRPKMSPSSCSVSTRSPTLASGSIALASSMVNSVSSSSISDRRDAPDRRGSCPSRRRWRRGCPRHRRRADMPTGSPPRRSGSAALAGPAFRRSAGGGHRRSLDSRWPPLWFVRYATGRSKKKRGGHPRHGAAVQLREVYTRRGGSRSGRPSPSGIPPARRRRGRGVRTQRQMNRRRGLMFISSMADTAVGCSRWLP